MNDSKNLTITLILSAVILLLWQVFIVNPRVQEQQQQLAAEQAKKENKVSLEQVESAALEQEVETPKVNLPRKESLTASPRITIKTPKLKGSIALKGARLDDLSLEEYHKTNDPASGDVDLLSPSSSSNAYFTEFGWLGAGGNIKTPSRHSVWQSDSKVLTPEQPVVLSWDNQQGLIFKLRISVDKDYLFTVEKSVENLSKEIVRLSPYGIINRIYDTDKQSFLILHEGVLAVADDVLQEVRYEDLKDNKKQEFTQTKGWIGITDKYWLTALIPDQSNSFDIHLNYFYKNNQERYQTDYLGQVFEVLPGATHTSKMHVFAGAKQLTILEKYSDMLSIPLFDRAVDFGWLYFLTKPIFKLLTFFHSILGNFGLAILMLTITIKLILFPLANKSYISMSKLKQLQPQLMELKKRYEHDRMQLNKEMMALYKREKVNPASGCLPLILQIPVFFALYKVLFITIEMRHAPFFGWIQDLSAPDPTSFANLFGLLPFNPPAFLMIGVWPLILGVTMFLQQKMNPAPADPTQAKVMKILPVVFTFIFATFPAGLVIYWSWNNTLSILQQWVITRKIAKKS